MKLLKNMISNYKFLLLLRNIIKNNEKHNKNTDIDDLIIQCILKASTQKVKPSRELVEIKRSLKAMNPNYRLSDIDEGCVKRFHWDKIQTNMLNILAGDVKELSQW